MFSNFKNSELGMIALALEEEDGNWRKNIQVGKESGFTALGRKGRLKGSFARCASSDRRGDEIL
jgi:hypothetical protein